MGEPHAYLQALMGKGRVEGEENAIRENERVGREGKKFRRDRDKIEENGKMRDTGNKKGKRK